MTEHAEPTESSGLTPEQRLSATNTHLLRANIVTIHDIETLRRCVAYENANQNRQPILRQLAERATELREE
ncbi:hypothetical protein J2752_000202 [Halarchaeum rubridurum]|uniref:DUF8129 domain-containing protein n=1 Tax=Halarchaeum rubridurum TaxID=489911 RepID=A0A8T4GKX4_9EURY|nr:hypothetical protein [Halarchaeum rubridurum]MBP1953321.1 hypothetical protein [Halarchaeum rubridurum]